MTMSQNRSLRNVLIAFALFLLVFLLLKNVGSEDGDPRVRLETGLASPPAGAGLEPQQIQLGGEEVQRHPSHGVVPADEEIERHQFMGRLVFPEESAYPLPFNECFVLVRGAPAEFGSGVQTDPASPQFVRIPVQTDGRFAFSMTAQRSEAEIAAIGSGCVAERDVTAAAGIECEVPMVYMYALDVTMLDAGDDTPVTHSEELFRKDANTWWNYTAPQHAGTGSHIVEEWIRSASRIATRPITRRHLITSTVFSAEGFMLRGHLRIPGYEDRDLELMMPPISGGVEEVRVYLTPLESDRCSIEFTVERTGGWDLVAGMEYRSLATLWLRAPGAQEFQYGAAPLDLRAGTRSLVGVPLGQPELVLELSEKLRVDEAESARWKSLDALGARDQPSLFHVWFEDAGFGALAVPAMDHPVETHTWIGIKWEGAIGYRGFRYAAGQGLVLDGLVPGRYQIYWGKNRAEFSTNVANRTVHATLEVRPGITFVPIP
jgi:hypothetical protein